MRELLYKSNDIKDRVRCMSILPGAGAKLEFARLVQEMRVGAIHAEVPCPVQAGLAVETRDAAVVDVVVGLTEVDHCDPLDAAAQFTEEGFVVGGIIFP